MKLANDGFCRRLAALIMVYLSMAVTYIKGVHWGKIYWNSIHATGTWLRWTWLFDDATEYNPQFNDVSSASQLCKFGYSIGEEINFNASCMRIKH